MVMLHVVILKRLYTLTSFTCDNRRKEGEVAFNCMRWFGFEDDDPKESLVENPLKTVKEFELDLGTSRTTVSRCLNLIGKVTKIYYWVQEPIFHVGQPNMYIYIYKYS